MHHLEMAMVAARHIAAAIWQQHRWCYCYSMVLLLFIVASAAAAAAAAIDGAAAIRWCDGAATAAIGTMLMVLLL